MITGSLCLVTQFPVVTATHFKSNNSTLSLTSTSRIRVCVCVCVICISVLWDFPFSYTTFSTVL